MRPPWFLAREARPDLIHTAGRTFPRDYDADGILDARVTTTLAGGAWARRKKPWPG
jgi:hypothetical protein